MVISHLFQRLIDGAVHVWLGMLSVVQTPAAGLRSRGATRRAFIPDTNRHTQGSLHRQGGPDGSGGGGGIFPPDQGARSTPF